MKRNNLVYLTAALLISLSSQLKAQKSPGFIGKHFMFGYTANIGNNIGIYEEDRGFALHFRHGIHSELLINRFASVGIEADYLKFRESTSIISENGFEPGEYNRIFESYSAGAYYKHYYGSSYGLIAPLGTFLKLKVFAEKMHHYSESDKAIILNTNYWAPGIGYGFGQSRVIGKVVRVEASVELNMLPTIFLPIVDVFARKNVFYLRHQPSYHHLRGYSTTARIGISGLLF